MLCASTSTPVLAHLTIEELTKGAWPASKPIGLQRQQAVKVRTYIDDVRSKHHEWHFGSTAVERKAGRRRAGRDFRRRTAGVARPIDPCRFSLVRRLPAGERIH